MPVLSTPGVRVTHSNNMSSVGGGEFDIDTPFHRRWLDLARNRQDPDAKMVDVGCSWGVNSVKALSLGAKVIATDIDAAHLAGLINGISNEEYLK